MGADTDKVLHTKCYSRLFMGFHLGQVYKYITVQTCPGNDISMPPLLLGMESHSVLSIIIGPIESPVSFVIMKGTIFPKSIVT